MIAGHLVRFSEALRTWRRNRAIVILPGRANSDWMEFLETTGRKIRDFGALPLACGRQRDDVGLMIEAEPGVCWRFGTEQRTKCDEIDVAPLTRHTVHSRAHRAEVRWDACAKSCCSR